MREIKFRAWFVNTGHEKNEPCMVNDYNSKIYLEFMGLNPRGNGYEVELMQFTGLQDVAGKDIYDGDILQLDSMVGIIQFVDAQFKIIFNSRGVRNDLIYFVKNEQIKIIGNIYENPELLELGQGKENYLAS